MSNAAALCPDLTGAFTRQLATFSTGLRYEDLPQRVVEKAKVCVLDSLGCMLFGSTLPWTRMVADMVREQGGRPQALILGTSQRTSVSQAVLVNGTAGHAFELDDSHTGASMHAGSVAVPVALALGEWSGAVSGREFLASIVAGYEVGLRVGMASAGNLFRRGFHSAAVCGVFASACVAARILRLDMEKGRHAMGIAGSLASGLMAAQEGAMVKRLHLGRAAQAGVYSALLARRGFTGIPDVLEAPFGGFLSAMAEQYEVDALTKDLGVKWETLAVGFKPYATAGAVQAALAALDHIMRAQGLGARDLNRVEVYCSSYCYRHTAWTYVPGSVASAQMNIYYALAAMAVDRAAMVEQFSEERLADPCIMRFIPQIEVQVDPRFDAMGNQFRLAARVVVRTVDGRRFEQEVLHRPGSADNPLSADRVVEKFACLAKHALPEGRARELIAATGKLDQSGNVREFVTTLRARRGTSRGQRRGNSDA